MPGQSHMSLVSNQKGCLGDTGSHSVSHWGSSQLGLQDYVGHSTQKATHASIGSGEKSRGQYQ